MIKVGDYLEIQKKKRNVDVCNFLFLELCAYTLKEKTRSCVISHGVIKIYF